MVRDRASAGVSWSPVAASAAAEPGGLWGRQAWALAHGGALGAWELVPVPVLEQEALPRLVLTCLLSVSQWFFGRVRTGPACLPASEVSALGQEGGPQQRGE